MRASSASVGLAGSGKDTGFPMKFFSEECSCETSPPHPTPAKAWAHFLFQKNLDLLGPAAKPKQAGQGDHPALFFCALGIYAVDKF